MMRKGGYSKGNDRGQKHIQVWYTPLNANVFQSFLKRIIKSFVIHLNGNDFLWIILKALFTNSF